MTRPDKTKKSNGRQSSPPALDRPRPEEAEGRRPDDPDHLHVGAATLPVLAPEQTKVLSIIDRLCHPALRQRVALRWLSHLRSKGMRCVILFNKFAMQLGEALRERDAADAALPEDEPRVRLPHWAPWVWTPPVCVLLARIEWPFVNWLPGLVALSGTVALFLAMVVEAGAWWLGRSVAARHQVATLLLLRDSERAALRWAAPLVVVIQGALFCLRLLRTGQLASSVALTVAVLVLAAISTFVHDLSTWAGEPRLRRANRRVDRLRRRLGATLDRYHTLRAAYAGVKQRHVVDPAQRAVAAVMGHIMAVDALLRRRGVQPGPWPVSHLLDARNAEARGELPDEFAFPGLDAGDGVPLSAAVQPGGGGEPA